MKNQIKMFWIYDVAYKPPYSATPSGMAFDKAEGYVRKPDGNKYLQSRTKYFANLLGSTENLNLKRNFNVTFLLFSTRQL